MTIRGCLKDGATHAEEEAVSTTPYPNGLAQVIMFVLGTFGASTVGIWRGLIYDLSPGAWIMAAVSGGLGMALTALAGRGSERQKVAGGAIIAVAFLLEVFRRRLGLGANVTVPLILLGAGSFLVAGGRITREVISRRFRTRRLLEQPLRDPSIAAQLDAYFAVTARLDGRLRPFQQELRRALRNVSRKPGASWQRAASALRAFAAALADYLDAMRSVPTLECLEEMARESREASELLHRECLNVARSLESGERPELTALRRADRRVLEAERTWHYAVGTLAARHRVSVPRWFLKLNCELAKAG